MTNLAPRPLHVIAADIRRTWPNVRYSAEPYLKAMEALDDIHDSYGLEDAQMIVLYFLNNATYWRGEDARRIKAELSALADF